MAATEKPNMYPTAATAKGTSYASGHAWGTGDGSAATALHRAPNVAYINTLRDYLQGRFAEQKRQIVKARALRSMTHTITIPAAYEKTTQQVRTPLLADMIQRVIAALTVNYPTWRATPLGPGDTAQKLSTLKEHWLQAAHKRMEAEAGQRIFRRIMSAAIGDGMGVMQYVYKPYRYPAIKRRKEEQGAENAHLYTTRVEETYKMAPFPFAWRDVDPLVYHYYEGPDGVEEVLLIEKVPLKPTMARLGVYEMDGEFRDYDPGLPIPLEAPSTGAEEQELLTHWTKTHVSYVLHEKMAKQIEHKWGKLPFFHFAGLSSHEPEMEKQYRPVFHAFQDLIPLLDRMLTMKTNVMYMMSFPQLIMKLQQSRGGSIPGVTPTAPEVVLGDILNLYQDEDFIAMQLPPAGPDLNQMVSLVLQMIETTGIGRAMRGDLKGDASGYAVNQLISASTLNFDPITDNAQFALEQGAQFLLWMIDQQVKRSVYVWGDQPKGEGQDWLALGQKEIKGYYWVQCKLEPLMPSNLIMEGRFGLEQAGSGAISLYTHRDQFLHLNPEEEEERVLIEKAKARVEDVMIEKAGIRAGVLQPAPPPPPPGPQLLGPDGRPLPLGNMALPSVPGQGMPMTPPAPANPVAGVPTPGLPGGSYGQQVVTNAQIPG